MTPRLAFTLLILAFTAPSLWSQTTYSPHSRFGFVELQSGGGSAQLGMGQMGAAWMDRHHLNTRNPAAAAFLTRTSFGGGFQVRSENILEGDSTTRGEVGAYPSRVCPEAGWRKGRRQFWPAALVPLGI